MASPPQFKPVLAPVHTERSLVAGAREPHVAYRVFIISCVRLYCDGLARSLADRTAIEVIGATAPGDDAIAAIGDTAPDIVLLDSTVLRYAGIVRLIASVSPVSLIVAFGVNDDPKEVLACAESGVAGFVPSSASIDDLVRILASVERGELTCSPRAAALMFQRVAALAERPPMLVAGSLTIREREIVDLMREGMSNKEIAAALCIELATVKSHVHHVLEKLGVSGRAAVAARVSSRSPRVGPAPHRSEESARR
jgi:two-component system nitrate/nitrite response regulator NarL